MSQQQIRLCCVYCVLYLLGICAVMDRNAPVNRLIGLSLILGGTAGFGHQAVLVYRRRLVERARAEEAARRLIKRSERRLRSELKRESLRVERSRLAAIAVRREHEREQERSLRAAALSDEMVRVSLHELELQCEAQRLQSLTHLELAAVAKSAFLRRGWTVSIPDSEAPFDLVLTSEEPDVPAQLARCVPPGRRADQTDVNALKAWMKSESSEHAFLVSVHGFDEGIVTMIGREMEIEPQNITLVEAHLLSLWTVGSQYQNA